MRAFQQAAVAAVYFCVFGVVIWWCAPHNVFSALVTFECLFAAGMFSIMSLLMGKEVWDYEHRV